MATDTAGHVYVASASGENRVRRINPGGDIHAFAGTGEWDFTGDGAHALDAAFADPANIAVDAEGNLYIPDNYNQRVRKVDTTGRITTIVGSGECPCVWEGSGGGFSGDGGPAHLAEVDGPRAVTVDRAGNIYIVDGNNNRIRKIDTSGTITTIAGNGADGCSQTPCSTRGDGGPATGTPLNWPYDLATDAEGNLYFTEPIAGLVRKVDTTGTISTIAGSGAFGFSGDGGPATLASFRFPVGVATDDSANVYVADGQNNRIRKIDNAGMITTVAGDGYGTPGQMNDAYAGPCLDQGGCGGRFSGDGGQAVKASLNSPRDVSLDAEGNLYIADRWNFRIRKVDTSGTITTIAGNGRRSDAGDEGPARDSAIDKPRAVTVGPDGNLYFTDTENNRIRRVNQDGTISTVVGDGYKKCDPRELRACEGRFGGDGGPALEASLNLPLDLAFDAAGNMFISDGYTNARIRRVDADTGVITTYAGNGQNLLHGNCDLEGDSYNQDVGDGRHATEVCISPVALTVGPDGDLYFYDGASYRIRVIDSETKIIRTYAGNGDQHGCCYGDGGPARDASFGPATGLAFDHLGNLYIATYGQSRIKKVTPAGIISTVAGDGSPGYSGDGGRATEAAIGWPYDVAVDPEGNIFFSDFASHQAQEHAGEASGSYPVRRIDVGGTITTIGGPCQSTRGKFWYSGEGVPATEACFDFPAGLTLDSAGHLYIAEVGDVSRIRRIESASDAVVIPPEPPVPAEECAQQISAPEGDAPNNAPAGDGRNVDELDVVRASLGAKDSAILSAEVQVKHLEATVPANGTSAHWYFHWKARGSNYYAGAELAKGASQPKFSLGTYTGSSYEWRSEADGSVQPGRNGVIQIDIPLAHLGNPAPGTELRELYATTFIGQGALENSVLFRIDRAPKSSSAFGSPLTLGVGCGSEPTPSPASPTGGPRSRHTYPVTPNDSHLARQWGLDRINARQAWQQRQSTGAGVRVAVIDSGIDLEHEDLQCDGKLLNGASVIGGTVKGGASADDVDGHGTHVAGVVGACTNNELGIAGVAPDVSLVPIRIFPRKGSSEEDSSTVTDIAQAIRWASDEGAHVINMSLGVGIGVMPIGGGAVGYLPEFVPEIDEAIEYAHSLGAVVVAAAGNDSLPLCEYPALAEDVICVGATDNRDLKAWYSTFAVKRDRDDGVGPALVAPGGSGQVYCDLHSENILSLFPAEFDKCDEGFNGYRGLDGTSMAAPHVAGAAALVYDRLGGTRTTANAKDVTAALLEGSDDLGPPGYDPIYGYGRLNALGAVEEIDVVDPSPTASARPTDSASPTDEPTQGPGPVAPVAPSNLTAAAVSSSRVQLGWADNSNNETAFAVERSGADGVWKEVATSAPNQTSFVDMGLEPNTTYNYRVRAYNSVGQSDYSNVASATTPAASSGGSGAQAPASPSDLAASSASSSRIQLGWTDRSGNEDGFAIERAGTDGVWQEIATSGRNQTSYVDSGLVADTAYRYRVRAYNSAGHSTYSNVAEATTQKEPAKGGAEPSPEPTDDPVEPVARGTATTSIAASRSLTTYNKGFEVSGLVERDDNCTGPLEVAVSRRVHGTSTYESIRSTPVNGAGSWVLRVRAQRNASYIAEVKDTDTCAGDPSVPTDVLVGAKITARVPVVCAGSVRGRVLPANEGEIVLQRRAKGRWVQVASDALNAQSRFALRATRCGVHRLVWAQEGAANEPARQRVRLR